MIARRIVMIFLLLLNGVVLLGQVDPEAAPPFAQIVNVFTLTATVLFLLLEIVRGLRSKKNGNAR